MEKAKQLSSYFFYEDHNYIYNRSKYNKWKGFMHMIPYPITHIWFPHCLLLWKHKNLSYYEIKSHKKRKKARENKIWFDRTLIKSSSNWSRFESTRSLSPCLSDRFNLNPIRLQLDTLILFLAIRLVYSLLIQINFFCIILQYLTNKLAVQISSSVVFVASMCSTYLRYWVGDSCFELF